MRAWLLESHNEMPRLCTVDDPSPAPGQVVVRVRAAGLNFADLLVIGGTYQDRHPLPLVPGFEFAGSIEAVPPGVAGLAVGDRVAGFCRTGAMAERVAVPATHLVRLPDHLPDVEAAALPVAYGTVQLALADKARLLPGETVFITGAAGGVGLAAVEVAARMGARVIASARGAARLATAAAAGAQVLIDSEAAGLKDRLRAEGGVDVVFDTVGGAGFDAAMRACRPDARMLAIGFASGEVPQIPANQLLVRNITVIGLWWGGYIGPRPDLLQGGLARLVGLPRDQALRPHVSHVVAFDDLPAGLALLRERKATGKVVLQV